MLRETWNGNVRDLRGIGPTFPLAASVREKLPVEARASEMRTKIRPTGVAKRLMEDVPQKVKGTTLHNHLAATPKWKCTAGKGRCPDISVDL